jgi:hypothetical protein
MGRPYSGPDRTQAVVGGKRTVSVEADQEADYLAGAVLDLHRAGAAARPLVGHDLGVAAAEDLADADGVGGWVGRVRGRDGVAADDGPMKVMVAAGWKVAISADQSPLTTAVLNRSTCARAASAVMGDNVRERTGHPRTRLDMRKCEPSQSNSCVIYSTHSNDARSRSVEG